MKSFFTKLIFLFACSPTFAATYYVKPNGNNSNNGLSVASAFQTLQRASNIVNAGDSVIILAGTYSGFYHTKSGTSSSPIVFHAQPGVIINAPNATTNDGINLEGANYVIIEGFKVYGLPRTGIRSVLNTGVIIRNNIADSCGKWGILTGFSENILIENNSCSRSVQEHGIYFSNSADNPIIRNNTCFGNSGCGIHMNADLSMGGDGIISNALVENNIIYNNGISGGSGINCDGVQNSRIQNNLLFNNLASGISLYKIDAAQGAKNNVVVNNTILQPSNGRWALNISDGSTGNIVFNNIFYSDHAFRGSITIDAASLTGFHSNYNILTNRMSIDGGNTVLTLAQWRSSTQSDSNSVISTPAVLFVNAAANDYHLLNASPAIDLGRMSYYGKSSPLNDLELIMRPQSNYPDAGCYEKLSPLSVSEYHQPLSDWNSLDKNTWITLYDLAGRVVYENTKENVAGFLFNQQSGIFIYKAVNLSPAFNQSTGKIAIGK